MTFPPQSVQVCKVGQRLFSFVLSKLLGWASSLDVRGSISIIELKGGGIVPSKRGINLQTRLGPLLKIQRRIVLARLVESGEKTQNICQ